MTKPKVKTIEQVRSDIEQYVIDRLVDIDDYIADTYEIDCWDSCLDGKVWNASLKSVTDMYVAAIVSDRDWDGKARNYAQAIDISTELAKAKVELEIKQLQKQLKQLEGFGE